MSNTNPELTKRLRQGDNEAFNELYWKYHAALYKNILKLTRDAIVGEDILQDVFVTLWEKRHTLDVDQDISGWLFVISYNKSANYLKQKLKESSVQVSSFQQNGDLVTDISDDLVTIRMNILEKAIEQLSPQKRRVFLMCKMQKKTYAEAADELNISKHTVKEYLSAAVLLIKNYIKRYPECTVILLTIILFCSKMEF